MRIGNYEILSHISHGTFGFVYKAIDLSTDRIVVLKMSVTETDSRKSVFKNEERILYLLRSLDVKYIPYFIESFNTKINNGKEKKHYSVIAMDIVNGDVIYEFIKKNPNIQPPILWSIFSQILLGIKYIHSKGVVHNDIKGDNIMIDKNYNIKFIDFGLSCIYNTYEKTCTNFQGTFHYKPPELQYLDKNDALLRDEKFVFGRDVWSIGVLFFRLANKLRLPYKLTSDNEELKQNIVYGPLIKSNYTLDDGRTNKFIEFILRKTWTLRPTVDECIEYMLENIFAPVYIRNYISSPTGFTRIDNTKVEE